MRLRALFLMMGFFLRTYMENWLYFLMLYLVPLTYLVVVFVMAQGSLEALATGLTGFVVMVGYQYLLQTSASFISNMFEPQIFETYYLMPQSFPEIIASFIAVTVLLISMPPVALCSLALAWTVGIVDVPVYLAGIVLMYAFFVPLAVLLAVTVKRAMTLSSILSFLMFVVIIASPVFYRLLYVSEPYRALLLLNPLTHIVVVLRSGSGLQEGFPAVSSITLLTLMSSALWVLLWYKLRGGVFTIVEKRG